MKHAACAVLLLLVSVPTRAAELVHRAGDTETVDGIAKNYYGAAWKAVYVQSYNNLTGKESLAGKHVTIPGSWTYTVRRGDSLTTIAKKHLGESSRYVAVMRFNAIKDPGDLEVGRELLMPFHLFYAVQAGDTLDKISRRYYRTTKYAALIKEYNGIDALKPGAKLIVPIFDTATLDLRKRRYTAPVSVVVPAPSPGEPAPPPEPVVSPAVASAGEEGRARLKDALASYDEGGFDEACTELDNLLAQNKVVGNDRIPLFKYLGFCAVAFADQAGARDYFRKWIELEPKASLDPILTSPKILLIFYEVTNTARPQPAPAEPPPEGTANP